jgi:hypothetical protein
MGSPLDNLARAHVTDLCRFVLVRKRCRAGTPMSLNARYVRLATLLRAAERFGACQPR